MKTQLSLIASALLVSGTAIAGSGSTQGDATMQTDDRKASTGYEASGQKTEDGYQGSAAGGYEYSSQNAQSSGSLSMETIAKNPEGSFRQLDRDGDGLLSRSDVRDSRPVLSNFDSADEDGDNMISNNEFNDLANSFEEEMAE